MARRPMRALDPHDGLVLKTATLYQHLAACAQAAYSGEKLERTLGELRNSGLGELHRRQPEIERDARRARRAAWRAAAHQAFQEGGMWP